MPKNAFIAGYLSELKRRIHYNFKHAVDFFFSLAKWTN